LGKVGRGSVYRKLQEMVEGRLWKWGIPLYGTSVREIWRGGSLAADPEGYERKALQTGISFHRSPAGEPGRGFFYQGL
jgi:hypothetical protein